MLEEVQRWLTGQGFPLEMRTASAFSRAGFEVRQSVLYTDSETAKSREIDILAIAPDVLGILRVFFVLECKASKKPWVLLTSPGVLEGYNRLFAFAVSTVEIKAAIANRIFHFMQDYPWLKKDGLIGYSLRQAFSETDQAYAAALGLAKASDDLIRRERGKYAGVLCLAFPVMVINSPLICCELTEAGEINLKEIEEGEFLFHADPPPNFGTCIRVVTANRLPDFALRAKKVADQLRADLKAEEQAIWSDMRGKKSAPDEFDDLRGRKE